MKVIITLIYFVLIVSCGNSKLRREAEAKATEFFTALKAGDEKALTQLYSGFSHFDTYFKSDSAKVVQVREEKQFVKVALHNWYTNGYGKVSKRGITLMLKRDSVKQLRIVDSKGLSDFTEKEEYVFGVKTGCVSKLADTTDQQILHALKKSHALMLDKALEVYGDLRNQIKVVSWNWESGYGGSGSGKGIIRNGSTFSVPKLKYKVTYMTSSGEAVTSDDVM